MEECIVRDIVMLERDDSRFQVSIKYFQNTFLAFQLNINKNISKMKRFRILNIEKLLKLQV